ncbi:trypsin-3-like, partial [Anoplophora glabripennis]|uniref:trypsin-3-like n=1 Tax=Anoplophora glabripennis TaxID=217634 RepID=UPI000C78797D
APIPSFLGVRAASSIRNSGGQVFSVLTVISHPQYDGQTLDFDIALLYLSASISIPNSRTIALPSPSTGPVANETAVITGWGATVENGTAANILQVVSVPIISQEECRAAYPSGITDRMFCAGLLGVGGRDSCQGDSGGPVVVNGVLYGLVSWGFGCARPESPGVYTNVPVLRAWITVNSGV